MSFLYEYKTKRSSKKNKLFGSVFSSVVTSKDISAFAKPFGVLLKPSIFSDYDELNEQLPSKKPKKDVSKYTVYDEMCIMFEDFEKVYNEYENLYDDFLDLFIKLGLVDSNVSKKSKKSSDVSYISKEFGKKSASKVLFGKGFFSKKGGKSKDLETIKYFDSVYGVPSVGFRVVIDLDISDEHVEKLNKLGMELDEVSEIISEYIYEYLDDLSKRINKEFKIIDEDGNKRNRKISEYRGYLVVELLYSLDELDKLIKMVLSSYDEITDIMDEESKEVKINRNDIYNYIIEQTNLLNSLIYEGIFMYNTMTISGEIEDFLDNLSDVVDKNIKKLVRGKIIGDEEGLLSKGIDIIDLIFGSDD